MPLDNWFMHEYRSLISLLLMDWAVGQPKGLGLRLVLGNKFRGYYKQDYFLREYNFDV